MLGRRGARAGRGMARGWTALCLLSLLPSMEFTNTAITGNATVSSNPGISSPVPTTTSYWKSMNSSTFRSTNLYNVSQDSNGTTAVTSASTVNFTSASETLPASGAVNSSVQPQTSLATTASSTLISFATSEATLQPSTFPGNISDSLYNSTSPVTSSINTSPSFSPTQNILKTEIKCSRVKEVKLAHSICLKLNETSSCEEFKKNNEEKLTQVLCQEEQAEVCSLLLAQSDVKPQCLLLVLANRTESSSKIRLLKRYQSDLREMGIQDISEEDVSSHQSYSRKTLIALVTSGILLAILITTCYFLMNRRSWSPAGERLVSSGLQGKAHEEARSPGEVHECHGRGGEIPEEVLLCPHTGMCVHVPYCVCGRVETICSRWWRVA
ncbi:hematopoietic progenitor cell antigen CD34 isoform X2 [Ovis aries]|uniref:hematopoietic progenitor cell antigen CD34 isoform X2 n=1 Tax=Ovis aries TaxID=9940 RepID=UPI0029527F17|nr:hematopoietic progenitor cell antigen CD34 isoform X2 [Ovis aries]